MKKRRHLLTAHIAGFQYYEGCLAFNSLEVGTKLKMKREANNKFDAYAVALYFNGYKLGFIPRSQNKEISKFLEMGYKNAFEVRINRISADNEPEYQIGIIVYLKKNKK